MGLIKNPDGTFSKEPELVQVTGSFMEYRILSSDPMPEAKADEKGAQLLIMDTGEVYFNHGGTWGVF